ncbi:MAG: hypothetical protein JSR09_10405 [Bacteroidetes bacterium]|nr:hypothetical protein [Bacteroidota bacterium]MBS1650102.1 hypothetical protein [Bacteroidota bacterium]
MKRLLLLAAIGSMVLVSKAQDYKKVQTMAVLKKLEEAKTELDKQIASNPSAATKTETYFWKMYIYNGLYKDERLKGKYPNALSEAQDAFNKYVQADPSLKILKDNNGSDIYFTLYNHERTVGNDAFTAKKYDEAAESFAKATDYIDVIIAHKFTNANIAFDTSMIFFTAYSYQQAKKDDIAYKYYKRLADSKVGGNEDYALIYKFLLLRDVEKKDKAEFDTYLKTAKELYPKENWAAFEAEYVSKNFTLQDKADFYDKQDAAGKLTAEDYVNYGSEFYNIPKEEKEKLDSAKLAVLKLKAIDAFKKAFAKDNSMYIAAFNIGLVNYLEFDATDETIRENIKKIRELNSLKDSEKDPKKKAAVETKNKPTIDAIKAETFDLDKKANSYVDTAIEWFEKAYGILKDKANKSGNEKNLTNKAIDHLAILFEYKRNKAKGKDQKAYDAYDAKYKLYDGLHQ